MKKLQRLERNKALCIKKLSDNAIPIKQLAEEFNISPPQAYLVLRQNIKKESFRYQPKNTNGIASAIRG